MNLGLVARDDATAEFLDGAARGEFLIQRCAACGRHSGPQAGQRQADDHGLVLVSGNGGILDHHSTLVLASERR